LLGHGARPTSVDDVAIPVDLGELSRDQIRQTVPDDPE
jgi:hypothetical protein